MTDPAQIRTVDGDTPRVHEDSWVAPGAFLLGNVIIEKGASIWYNAVLRGDRERITIGEDSNIQDLCAVHTDANHPTTLGRRVSVGHQAVLHGCTVEDDALIGMGAVVLNGAVIGAGSMVAAGAVVLEGTQIPPGSLVAGVPGKVRRSLSAEEQQGLVVNAEGYLHLRDLHVTADA